MTSIGLGFIVNTELIPANAVDGEVYLLYSNHSQSSTFPRDARCRTEFLLIFSMIPSGGVELQNGRFNLDQYGRRDNVILQCIDGLQPANHATWLQSGEK